MTKVIILGEPQGEEAPKKKIEFVEYFHEGELLDPLSIPSQWENIELICKNYMYGGKDLMFAYGNDRNGGVLYLGHFNDGVV